MRIENVGLEHQELLTHAFQTLSVNLSEYSFANCYLFRREHDFKIVYSDHLFLAGITRDKHRFLMPTVRLNEIPQAELRALMHDYEFIYPIPDEWLDDLSQECLENAYYVDAESDYFYKIDKLQLYPGRHLSAKRNLVHQFVDHYPYMSYPLTPNYVDDALLILDIWQNTMEESVNESDYFPCMDALNGIEKLHLRGKIYYIEDKPVGFALGEQMNPDVFDLHFVKADKFYKGIYAFINQDFAQSLDGEFKYVNFEPDLGNPNLQHSKSSYQPDQRLRKWRISCP